jgi:MerR family transcriptional regulator, light-induced transcriptional regulator
MPSSGAPVDVLGLRQQLAAAFRDLDEERAEEVLDGCFEALALEEALRDVVVPLMHGVGEDWASGALSVAQEHFATQVVRGRLTVVSRGWSRGEGRVAWLACPPGELHDLPLFAFGIVLHQRGWRIRFFGAHTPVHDLIAVARVFPPDLVVLAATTPHRFAARRWELTRLAQTAPLALAGEGATWHFAEAVGAELLTGDPVTAAQHVALHRSGSAVQEPA